MTDALEAILGCFLVILSVSLSACKDNNPMYPGHELCTKYNGTHYKVTKCCYTCVLENETPKQYIILRNGIMEYHNCNNVDNGLQYAATMCPTINRGNK